MKYVEAQDIFYSGQTPLAFEWLTLDEFMALSTWQFETMVSTGPELDTPYIEAQDVYFDPSALSLRWLTLSEYIALTDDSLSSLIGG